MLIISQKGMIAIGVSAYLYKRVKCPNLHKLYTTFLLDGWPIPEYNMWVMGGEYLALVHLQVPFEDLQVHKYLAT